jgi:IS5 family transposase
MTRISDPQINFADLEFLAQGVELDPLLNRISEFLNDQPTIIESVRQDLQRGLTKPSTGRIGMTAAQVLHSLILMRVKNWDYRELCERIADGYTLRRFTGFYSKRVPKHDAFNRAFNKLRPQSLQAINDLVIKAAVDLGLEDGKRLRVDTTVTETDIHHPTDSTLLWDVVRVLTRLIGRLAQLVPTAADKFPNRTRAARRRMQELQRMTLKQRHTQQKRKYRELIKITQQVLDHAREVLEKTKDQQTVDLIDEIIIAELRRKIDHYGQLASRVVDQSRRRVLKGEQVAAEEKIYSIFEPHTNLIKRGKVQKPIEFGHKIFLAETVHGLISQYRVLEGNPADQLHVVPSLKRHQQHFGLAPHWYSSDRAFFSNENIKACQEAAVKLVCIPQPGGQRNSQQQALEKSSAFKKGQRFRAGIEGRISVLFRGRGMKRSRVKGLERFEVLVGAAVLTNNLMIIARLLNQRQKRFRHAA